MDPDRGVAKSQTQVFVYGTLMEGFTNYDCYLEGQVISAMKGEATGQLCHLSQGYPALVEDNKVIKGEVMELIDRGVLENLDRLEGFVYGGTDNIYERVIRTAVLESGERVECWVYLFCDKTYAENSGVEIPDGDWKKFILKKDALR